MKRYLIPILVVSVLASGLVVGCGTKTSSERDEALTFYRGVYPLYMDFFDTVDKWTQWTNGASPQEYTLNLNFVAGYNRDKFETLSHQISMVDAPPQLKEVKDTIISAINKLIEYFVLTQAYARTRQETYRLQAEAATLEYSKLLGFARASWENGIARYNIQSSEIVK